MPQNSPILVQFSQLKFGSMLFYVRFYVCSRLQAQLLATCKQRYLNEIYLRAAFTL